MENQGGGGSAWRCVSFQVEYGLDAPIGNQGSTEQPACHGYDQPGQSQALACLIITLCYYIDNIVDKPISGIRAGVGNVRFGEHLIRLCEHDAAVEGVARGARLIR